MKFLWKYTGIEKLIFFLFVFTCIQLVILCEFVYAKNSKLHIEYKSEKLTANIFNQNLEKVMKLVARKTGIVIFLDKSLKSKTVSAKFENISMEKGLKNIVVPFSTAFVYKKNQTINGEEIFSILEMKIYDKGKNDIVYMEFSKTNNATINNSRSSFDNKNIHNNDMMRDSKLPERVFDPALSAAHSKKVNKAVLRAMMQKKFSNLRTLNNRLTNEENRKLEKMNYLKNDLNNASDEETKEIKKRILLLNTEFENSRQRLTKELKQLQNEYSLLKKRIVAH